MPAWMRFSLFFGMFTVLVGSHWLAYKMGIKWESDQINNYISLTEASSYEDQLRTSNSVLQVAVRFPSDFAAEEIAELKEKTENNVKDIERVSLPLAKQMGNLDLEKRITTQIKTARNLLTRLRIP